ncbi:hypothetical protein [Microbacterium sp. Root180]|uniref:hypothetical protein n=1 Tax=Microbacterium sp. Root180 TaxID=1736483 RepID=UPI0006FFDF69|nr:hypothetical protein [Microbacterium sp. Root180]KRB36500.1 hypothetical protein ASD93_10555 [Microbacterium sp. Root180]
MTSNPVPPVIPPADDGDRFDAADVLDGDDRPLDPDLDDDRQTSAAADERAAREGELDGDIEDRP